MSNKNGKDLTQEEKDGNFKQENVLSVTLSLKAHLFKFIGLISLFLGSYYLYMNIPAKGIRIYQILGYEKIPMDAFLFWKKFLVYKFHPSTLAYPLIAIIIISLLMMIYYYLDVKMTQYEINYRYIEYRKGVFNRTVDTIDLVSITDPTLERSLLDRILGLSELVVLSKDISCPELHMWALDKDDAEKFLNFIRQNAYQNFTEYRIAKDRKFKNSARKDDDTDVIDTNEQ